MIKLSKRIARQAHCVSTSLNGNTNLKLEKGINNYTEKKHVENV